MALDSSRPVVDACYNSVSFRHDLHPHRAVCCISLLYGPSGFERGRDLSVCFHLVAAVVGLVISITDWPYHPASIFCGTTRARRSSPSPPSRPCGTPLEAGAVLALTSPISRDSRLCLVVLRRVTVIQRSLFPRNLACKMPLTYVFTCTVNLKNSTLFKAAGPFETWVVFKTLVGSLNSDATVSLFKHLN